MSRQQIKRETDLLILSDWISPKCRVLDLGCGRGVLLEHLIQTKHVWGIGVDIDHDKILACVRRGLSVYQGDAEQLLSVFPDGHFDWVICSRTVQELEHPARVIRESLRVGRQLAVGFVNYGYWRNRLSHLRHGHRIHNEVFSHRWEEDRPTNPVTIGQFEHFCRRENFRILRRVWLRGDWRTPCHWLKDWLSGYAVYELAAPPHAVTLLASPEGPSKQPV